METEAGVRKLRKDIGVQDLIGWTAGMEGCMEDIGSPAVHGGRVFLVHGGRVLLVRWCHQILISLSDI